MSAAAHVEVPEECRRHAHTRLWSQAEGKMVPASPHLTAVVRPTPETIIGATAGSRAIAICDLSPVVQRGPPAGGLEFFGTTGSRRKDIHP